MPSLSGPQLPAARLLGAGRPRPQAAPGTRDQARAGSEECSQVACTAQRAEEDGRAVIAWPGNTSPPTHCTRRCQAAAIPLCWGDILGEDDPRPLPRHRHRSGVGQDPGPAARWRAVRQRDDHPSPFGSIKSPNGPGCTHGTGALPTRGN